MLFYIVDSAKISDNYLILEERKTINKSEMNLSYTKWFATHICYNVESLTPGLKNICWTSDHQISFWQHLQDNEGKMLVPCTIVGICQKYLVIIHLYGLAFVDSMMNL